MEPFPRDTRLARRAYWLIRLRWLAIIGVIIATFVARNLLNISVHSTALYCIAVVLTVYNSVFFVLLDRTVRPDGGKAYSSIHRIVSTQISLDLILLTVLIHYSGGIENPFLIYFVFHMVIASILLPVWESFLQGVLAVCLVVFLLLLEYKGIINHYCLSGLIVRDLHHDGRLLAVTSGVFSTMVFMIIYMTGSISRQLRNQEEAYWEANIELKAKDKVKDEYVSRVTHDIKGHLAAIQSCLEVVANNTLGPLNERQAEFVGRAQNRTRILARFVRALLHLTQMRLSKKMDMVEFSLAEVVENTVMTVAGRAKSKSIELSSSVDESVGKMVGNRFSIEEMVMNILLNALKYTGEGGSVAVTAKSHDDCYEVTVSDSGIGIPAGDLEHVFDEFYRASNAKKVERDGTGLGLSIVKQIVEEHGGSIQVESRVGYGSTFRFRLPKSQSVD